MTEAETVEAETEAESDQGALGGLDDVGEQQGAGHRPDAAGVGREEAGDLGDLGRRPR